MKNKRLKDSLLLYNLFHGEIVALDEIIETNDIPDFGECMFEEFEDLLESLEGD